jgi:CRP-like cAMP-binding protein
VFEVGALERTTLAVLDGATALTLRAYPEITAVVLDRIDARAERLAVSQAISQITGVETRIEALLWQLSERWGRVGRDGVIVGLTLSHRLIGALVGARRPTVSTALARLAADGRVLRRPDGRWLLAGDGPRADGATQTLAA